MKNIFKSKINLAIAGLVGLSMLIMSGLILKYVRNSLPTSKNTGIVRTTPEPEVIELGKAVSNLKKSLPITGNGFEIIKYNYKTGKFIIYLKPGSENFQDEFNLWLQTSEYSSIPPTMFQVND